jgi:hypothetical protein
LGLDWTNSGPEVSPIETDGRKTDFCAFKTKEKPLKPEEYEGFGKDAGRASPGVFP